MRFGDVATKPFLAGRAKVEAVDQFSRRVELSTEPNGDSVSILLTLTQWRMLAELLDTGGELGFCEGGGFIELQA